jgi:hypothetical protein
MGQRKFLPNKEISAYVKFCFSQDLPQYASFYQKLSEEKHESFRQYVTDCLLNGAMFVHRQRTVGSCK